MKRLKVYYVMREEEAGEKLLSIVNSKKEAREFSANYLRLEKGTHFLMWCNMRKLNPMLESSWLTYAANCISYEDLGSFKLRRVYLKGREVAEAFRVLCGFYPLGLSYEGPLEIGMLTDALTGKCDENFIKRLSLQSQFSPIMQNLLNMIKAQVNGKQ